VLRGNKLCYNIYRKRICIRVYRSVVIVVVVGVMKEEKEEEEGIGYRCVYAWERRYWTSINSLELTPEWSPSCTEQQIAPFTRL
jgi:hypothetical protein